MQVLILGCGDIGTRVGLTLVDSGWCVAAARRRSGRLPESFEPFEIDLTDPKCFEVFSVLRPDYVVVTPTPQTYDPGGYRAGFLGVASTLARQPWLKRCRRVIWISSTRVYRESDGNWIDEHSALNVDEPQASAMVDAEAAIRRAATATIIRPAGVYGDPEGMLMRRVRAGVGGAAGGQYGNRIHREDLARLIVHCLQRDASGHEVPPTLIAADHDTTPTHEIESWLASQLGVTLERGETSQRQPANRRCQNALLGQIGFSLSYPTWREGYKAALEALGQSIRA